MTGILSAPIFEDPPLPGRGHRGGYRRQTWSAALRPLTKAPGCWARVADYSNHYVAHITASKLRCGGIPIPSGEWEFISRGPRIYARFISEGGSA